MRRCHNPLSTNGISAVGRLIGPIHGQALSLPGDYTDGRAFTAASPANHGESESSRRLGMDRPFGPPVMRCNHRICHSIHSSLVFFPAIARGPAIGRGPREGFGGSEEGQPPIRHIGAAEKAGRETPPISSNSGGCPYVDKGVLLPSCVFDGLPANPAGHCGHSGGACRGACGRSFILRTAHAAHASARADCEEKAHGRQGPNKLEPGGSATKSGRESRPSSIFHPLHGQFQRSDAVWSG